MSDVRVSFTDDKVQILFLGHEVWVSRRNPFGDDVGRAVQRQVMATIRSSRHPTIWGDVDGLLRDILEAVHGHPEFMAWEVMSV